MSAFLSFAFYADALSPIPYFRTMPTYVYETVPHRTEGSPERFEYRQSMNDAALTQHPETGEPVRRVIVGGTGIMGGSTSASPAQGGGCGGSCACHP